MRRVLDSCVGFKWHLPEEDSDKALAIRDDFLKGIVRLLAPDVFPVEFVHSLTRAERQGRITPLEGAYHLRDMLVALPELHPSLPLIPRAYEISSHARIGVYDCLYVALAEREGCEPITADEKPVKNHQPDFLFIVSLSST